MPPRLFRAPLSAGGDRNVERRMPRLIAAAVVRPLRDNFVPPDRVSGFVPMTARPIFMTERPNVLGSLVGGSDSTIAIADRYFRV